MSTARFARSGRVRICILMSMFTVLILMIVIYHMSQQQLDETRAFRLRCEQNQEGLNVQLQCRLYSQSEQYALIYLCIMVSFVVSTNG